MYMFYRDAGNFPHVRGISRTRVSLSKYVGTVCSTYKN